LGYCQDKDLPGQGLEDLSIVFFKYHIVESVAMGGMISRLVIYLFRILITGMMVAMFDGTVCGNGIQEGFGMVMMRHQVVPQES
jgi:hypothetical protein